MNARSHRSWFSPAVLGALLAALVAAAIMVGLGVWQWHVYAGKSARATAAVATRPPAALTSLVDLDSGLPGSVVGRRVTLTGTWQPADQVYVTGRTAGGTGPVGAWVVTPVLVAPDAGVLVVRGWVPRPGDAAASAPTGRVTVSGVVLTPDSDDATFTRASGVTTVSSLRIPALVSVVRYRLYDLGVVETSAAPTDRAGLTLVAPPPPAQAHDGIRNAAYAIQWFVFAVFALGLWVRFGIDRAQETRNAREAQPA